MMLIDGAPRLSLNMKRNQFVVNNNNFRSRQKKKGAKAKKRVRFDMTHKTCVRSIPKVRKQDAEYLWHSNIDYSFFVLNWKYYPHEPMEPRSFLDTLWQVKNTPETMRMEDYQSFQPQEQPKRTQIREAVLQAFYQAPTTRCDQLAPLSASLTAKHKRQAQVCGALNEKEVQDYLHASPIVTRDEIMPQCSRSSSEKEQQDAMTFLSDYVDSIIHRTAALWTTI